MAGTGKNRLAYEARRKKYVIQELCPVHVQYMDVRIILREL